MLNRFLAAVLAIAPLAASGPALAQSATDLLNDHRTAGDVLTYGMGYNNQRYSALKSINKSNVS
jgi:alcohol dehydrogenase (cytochrome c)